LFRGRKERRGILKIILKQTGKEGKTPEGRREGGVRRGVSNRGVNGGVSLGRYFRSLKNTCSFLWKGREEGTKRLDASERISRSRVIYAVKKLARKIPSQLASGKGKPGNREGSRKRVACRRGIRNGEPSLRKLGERQWSRSEEEQRSPLPVPVRNG